MAAATQSTSAGIDFKSRFNAIQTFIPFKPEWHNGTGYFDALTRYPLQPGDIAKMRDENGRRIILMGTRFGTVVVFDRYKDQTDGGVYVVNHNGNPLFKLIFGSGAITGDTMAQLFWRKDQHIHHIIEEIAEHFMMEDVLEEVD